MAGSRFSLRRLVFASALLGGALAFVLYRANRAFGDFLADEGYLWYGVQRVLAGEVPLRDFMSYEIGRYYLAAALLAPFGAKGLLALRAAMAVFAGLSLALCTGMAGYHWKESRAWRLAPAAALFALWLVPRHKVFDIAISGVLVLAAYRLFLRPGAGRFFQWGVAVGFAAVIGQNHGFYGLLASVLAFAWLWRVERAALRLAALVSWAAGVVVGYLPVLGFALFAQGFAQAEWSALHYLLVEYKGTNLPLPLPWPWVVWPRWPAIGWSQALGSLWFTCLPMTLAVAGFWLWLRGRRGSDAPSPLAAAAWVVALPYLNVAFSRADISHLAQAMLPFLVLCLAALAPAGRNPPRRLVVPVLLLLVSLPVASALQPRYAAFRGQPLEQVDVLGDKLMVSRRTASLLALADREGKGRPVLAVPVFPGLDAALGMRSPTWEIFPLFPRKPDFERQEMARIAAESTALVLVAEGGVDHRPELAYPATHPLTYQYVVEHFDRMPDPGQGLEAYKAKGTHAPARAQPLPVSPSD
ncbi:hypothetical protein ACFWZ4_12670 [Frateuria sp. GZRe12]|uniref:hypothetical protein n=1 Tax=Frateuria sp. GZRe12 TaxID=3351533 RepID=UPI003EDC3535